ncbi:DUF1836 domain-containing protein [Bacillus luteolus]|uniref:DUF1836 domain-containing protein n=1 Tax=Litchfieldia luteola TaxID=682179 RepID=A0ABR9QLX0_9BACI|nr:DUF1836 domain-containing protein [Cytobacillus luteolus]MBE4909493.1 DUF1836 domain-containing protein [Cytobacillus luteolus]MBP1940894.1 hypothetical protein [Cytobacillus luteolus]
MKTFQCNRLMLSQVFTLLRAGTIDECFSVIKEANDVGLNEQIGLLSILKKFKRRGNSTYGFSLNEIATIGNQIEFAGVTSTAVANWVKRDVKDLIGSPLNGKKYSIDQAVIILIVEDLKMVLDFDSIRKVLSLVFNNLEDRHDDLIDPVSFYNGYAFIYDKVSQTTLGTSDKTRVEKEAHKYIEDHCTLQPQEQEIVKNVMVLAIFAVHASAYKMRAHHYLQTTLQMGD